MGAFLLKAASLLGFRPSLAACAECGTPRASEESVVFSSAAGGMLCADCAATEQASLVPVNLLNWVDALIRARFSEMGSLHPDADTLRALLRFAQEWCDEHLAHLKSLPFALSLLPT